jgi:hypothetical protein
MKKTRCEATGLSGIAETNVKEKRLNPLEKHSLSSIGCFSAENFTRPDSTFGGGVNCLPGESEQVRRQITSHES